MIYSVMVLSSRLLAQIVTGIYWGFLWGGLGKCGVYAFSSSLLVMIEVPCTRVFGFGLGLD